MKRRDFREPSAWRHRTAATAVLALALCFPASSAGGSGLRTGFLDGLYGSSDPTIRGEALDRTVGANADLIRVHVFWRSVAAVKPTAPSNPIDPAYNWDTLDDTVRDAADRGLEVVFTVTSAPDWAEGANRPGDAAPGVWKPNADAYGEFAQAVAERYSGNLLGLPSVRYFQAWNEPNLSNHLAPQYSGKQAKSPEHYRRMLNAFYAGVKSVRNSNLVVTGGTAPYGDPRGGDRMRPLVFWRDVLCLQRRRLRPSKCPTKAKFDVLAHHPINTSGGPRRSAFSPDDASTPDFRRVRRTLRAAERGHTVGTKGRHPLWATEIWWESDPPDNVEGVPIGRHARWLEEALYLLWKQGAKVVINLQLRDSSFDPNEPFDETVTGVYFQDWSPKPALTAWRFPFVTDRLSPSRVRAWGKAPTAGQLTIEREREGATGWWRVKSLQVRDGGVFAASIPARGRPTLRARINGEFSLPWRVGR